MGFRFGLGLTNVVFFFTVDLMSMTHDRDYQRLAVRIFADFSGSIAVPAVLAALAGSWLDDRHGTEPWWLMGCLVLAFVLTACVLWRKAKRYRADYERLIKMDSS